MAVESEKLLAVFEARFSSLEKAFQKIGGHAKQTFGDMEAAGTRAENALKRIGAGGAPGFDRMARSAKGASIQTGNIAAQFQDIAVQLQSGTSPFTIAVQQAGQLTGALGSGGAGSAVKALGAGFLSLVSPLNLATVAAITLGGSLIQYFAEWASSGTKTTEEIEKQGQLIQRLAARYGDSIPVLKAYADQLQRAADAADKLTAKQAILDAANAPTRTALPDVEVQFVSMIEALRRYGVANNTIDGIQDAFAQLAKRIADGSDATNELSNVQAKLNTLYENVPLQSVSEMLDTLRDLAPAVAKAADETGAANKQFNEVTLTLDQMKTAATAVMEQFAGFQVSGTEAVTDITNAIVAQLHPALEKVKDYLGDLERGFASFESAMSNVPLGNLPPIYSGGGNFLNEQQLQDYRASNTSSQFQQELQQASGAINAFVNRVVRAESGGRTDAKNPNSSATGVGQFIASTWIDQFKKVYPAEAATMTDQAILAFRKDADRSRTLIAAYARENAAVLQQAGVHVDEAALQLAHFLGAGDAAKVLRAAPGTPLSGLISQASINANPTVLGGGRTVDDAISYAQGRATAPVGGSGQGRTKRTPEDIFQGRVDDVQKRIDMLNAELEAQKGLTQGVTDYGFAVEQAKIKADLLNEAKQAGLEITPALSEKIDQLATNYAKLSAQQEQTKASQEAFNQTAQEFAALGKDVLGGFISDLRQGKSASEALANALNKVADKLLDMALNAIFSPTGGGGGGFLGFLGSIFGGGKAKGGPVSSSKAYVVGEKGPEIFSPGRSGMITPNDMLAGPPSSPVQRRAASSPISITLAPVIDNRGASVEAVARTQQQLDKLKAELPAHVIKAVRQANNSRVKLT